MNKRKNQHRLGVALLAVLALALAGCSTAGSAVADLGLAGPVASPVIICRMGKSAAQQPGPRSGMRRRESHKRKFATG